MQESSLAKVPQSDVKLELDDPPTREEIKKATMQLKVGKSPDIDGIPVEVYQHGGKAVLDKLQGLFTNCWEKGTLPKDLRDAVIVSLYKNNGEKSDCSNYRGITLLFIAGKILARVNRLIPTIAQENTPESQCGSRSKRHDLRGDADTGEMQGTEHGRICSFCRLDQGLSDCQPRWTGKFWRALASPPPHPAKKKIHNILRQLYEGQQGQVKHRGSLSVLISNGVKQECVLAPTLFSIFFSIMLHEAKEDLPDVIYIPFRTDGSVFNLRRLLAFTKTVEELITELLFADD